MKLRYVIQHHPGLATHLFVENEAGQRTLIEDRMSWAVVRENCRHNCRARGVEPVIEKPEPYVETFPWITVEA